MRLPLPLFAVALAFVAAPLRADTPAAASPSSSDSLLPPPHTWGLGIHGFGPLFRAGQPSVRYILNDNWAFELTQSFSYNHSHISPTQVSKSIDERTTFDILRTLGTYNGLKLSALVEPRFEYNYSRTDNSNPFGYNKSPTATFDLNAGLELEYFLRRDFSLAARAVYAFSWARNPVYSSFFPGQNAAHTASMAIDGESFALHYYFEGPSTDAPVSEAGPGSWAIGWAGIGGLYDSDYQPTFKYVWSDKTAFELIPELAWQHNNSGGTYTHNQSFRLFFDVERKLMTRGAIVISGVLEPSVGGAYSESKFSSFYSQQKSYSLGLGVGPEIEYFLRSNISFGARALLVYSNSIQSNYTQTGYAGQGIFHNVNLSGQVLNAHWYFGGKGGGS